MTRLLENSIRFSMLVFMLLLSQLHVVTQSPDTVHLPSENTHEETPIGTLEQSLSIGTSNLWTSTIIPTCWEEPKSSDLRERNWVRDAVENSWERESAINFIGWGACHENSRGIRITVDDDEDNVYVVKPNRTQEAGNKGDISDVFTLNRGRLASSVHDGVEGSAA